MDYSLMTRLLAEFLGTAILLILGNGAVANVSLKGTKGYKESSVFVAMGFGFGVMFPVLMFGGVSGAHINPAVTIGQAVMGMFPWGEVAPYVIAQLLGAAVGQLVVFLVFLPHYRQTDDAEAIFGTFATDDAAGSKVNYFITEFFATLMLVLVILAGLMLPWGKENPAAVGLGVGLVVWALVMSFGGTTGPAANPARDLMPRLLHALLPIEHKGSSKWGEAWIPVVADIAGGIAGAALVSVFL